MRRIWHGFCFILLFAGCFGLGLNWREIVRGKAPTSGPILKLMGFAKAPAGPASEDTFEDTYSKILADFVKPVDAKELKYAAMAGLMASLGDPHTMFMVPKLAADFSVETRGNFVGVGARLSPDPLGAKVVVVFDEGPAFRAGLRPNDTIIEVDGKSVAGVAVDDIVQKVRGVEGTPVKLTILSPGKTKPNTLTIVRAQVTTPTVEGRFVESNKFGILSVASFSEPTSEQFDSELAELEKKGIRGLVIDLRNNPGGLLETADQMLSKFIEGKVFIRTVSRGEPEDKLYTRSGSRHEFRYPVVVLVNEDSASAAEIFSGALQDYKVATIVGTHSYGKASVQEPYPLIDGSVAKITIARYLLPLQGDIGRRVDDDGTFITGGIHPDVEAPFNDDDEKAVFGDPATDAQLKKCFEILASKQP